MIDPVEMPEFDAGDVVVDIDHEEFFEPAQPRAFQAVALQQNRRIVAAANVRHGVDGIGARQLPILNRNAIGRYQMGSFPHLLDHHAQRQHGAHSIAIGTRVRTDQKSFASMQGIEDRREGMGGGNAGTRLSARLRRNDRRMDSGCLRKSVHAANPVLLIERCFLFRRRFPVQGAR